MIFYQCQISILNINISFGTSKKKKKSATNKQKIRINFETSQIAQLEKKQYKC